MKTNWNSAEEFVAYLQHTLIPDLRESGRDATADDFEDAVEFIQQRTAHSRKHTPLDVAVPLGASVEAQANVNAEYRRKVPAALRLPKVHTFVHVRPTTAQRQHEFGGDNLDGRCTYCGKRYVDDCHLPRSV